MNAEEKFLIDVALFALIVAMWIRWHRKGSGRDGGAGSDSGEAC
jgi:hypothetical protein